MNLGEYEKINSEKQEKDIGQNWVLDFDFETCNLITEARLKAGLTQAQLAKKIGTQQPSIARVESGSVLPSLGFLKKIAIAIGTSLVPPKFGFMINIERVNGESGSQTISSSHEDAFPTALYGICISYRSNTESSMEIWDKKKLPAYN